MRLHFHLESSEGDHSLQADIADLVIAGWAGRDHAGVLRHIKELEALGVTAPKSTPVFYRLSSSCLSQAASIQVIGAASSGEVEVVQFGRDGKTYITVGSDHTDRDAETYNVSISKGCCEKPVASKCWALDEVAPHWDELRIRSFIHEGGQWKLYQEGPLSSLLPHGELTSGYAATAKLPDGIAMFCGTLPALGGIRFASEYRLELEDPVLGRKLGHSYSVVSLPNEG